MNTFAADLSNRIKTRTEFWQELGDLEALGLRSTLPMLQPLLSVNNEGESEFLHAPNGKEASARLLSAASVFLQADDENKDLAQRIAVYTLLTSQESLLKEAAFRVLSDLGNYPSLSLLDVDGIEIGLQTHLRHVLQRSMNTVQFDDSRTTSLTDFQMSVWTQLQSATSLAVSAPTSAGKSFVVMEYLCQQLAAANQEFSALYIAPTRALIAEVHAKLEARFRDVPDSVRITTVPIADREKRPKQVYVLTQERVQLLLSVLQPRLDLVIVDEAQSIGDSSRGIILQDSLEKLKVVSGGARFFFLAPGVSGFDKLTAVLGIENVDVNSTEYSPVLQNRIVVTVDRTNEHKLRLEQLAPRGRIPVGVLEANRGFGKKTRLAAVALELGKSGSSLVYGTGPAAAEKLARSLAAEQPVAENEELDALGEFIRNHVHSKYSLRACIKHGVGFHYGNMPSLLREGIEAAFKSGALQYLCCTTTLFQGVNLPARNVFIDTPTRGRSAPLDDAALWNFAGRAGRLGEEVVGNVFLVDYDEWAQQRLDKRKQFELKIAFTDTLREQYSAVAEILSSAAERRPASIPTSGEAAAAAGLLLLRVAQGNAEDLLNKSGLNDIPRQEKLLISATAALESLQLPLEVLATNWTVPPAALSRLLTRFKTACDEGTFEQLLPLDPDGDVFNRYRSVFRTLLECIEDVEIGSKSPTHRFVAFLAVSALKWMRGAPLSQLIDERVRYNVRAKGKTVDAVVDSSVRTTFSFIEQDLRFKYVQLGKAYVDLLRYALIQKGLNEAAASIFDFPLALELGVATGTGRSLVELGLSRTSAAFLESFIPDSSKSPSAVRAWLKDVDLTEFNASTLIIGELQRKGLVRET